MSENKTRAPLPTEEQENETTARVMAVAVGMSGLIAGHAVLIPALACYGMIKLWGQVTRKRDKESS